MRRTLRCDIAADDLQLGRSSRPQRQHRLVSRQLASTDQQAEQIALGLAQPPFPALQSAVIMQDQFVPRHQLTGRHPGTFDQIACLAGDLAHRMIGGQAQCLTLGQAQLEDRLVAGDEEAG